ncbi:hypothetical protein PCCS19_48290 [Paenibacillus sp. CCS19]|nr:hypothetical protein PCCS19_48290 [Paenibacillus cellulosilyticus]
MACRTLQKKERLIQQMDGPRQLIAVADVRAAFRCFQGVVQQTQRLIDSDYTACAPSFGLTHKYLAFYALVVLLHAF